MTRSTDFAREASPSGTVCDGSIVRSALVTAIPASSSAVRTDVQVGRRRW